MQMSLGIQDLLFCHWFWVCGTWLEQAYGHDYSMKPTTTAATIIGSSGVDFVSDAPEEGDDEADGEDDPVFPPWLNGSLSPEPDDFVAVALVWDEVVLLDLVWDVASVVAGVDAPLAALVVDAGLLDEGASELAEETGTEVVEAAAEEETVLLFAACVPALVPNPILALSKSSTVYTFLRNTSPRIQSFGPKA